MKVKSSSTIYAFADTMEAAAECSSGSILCFETIDALGGQITDEAATLDSLDFSQVNPATGPVFVRGAEPGDALLIQIRDIVTSDRGVMLSVPGLGVLGDSVRRPATKIVPIGGTQVFFDNFVLPKQPMIGVIGTAPQTGSIPCGTPGDHGGNMDTKTIAPGSSLYLPVFQPGGLLALGDVHAAMADGEVCGTGVECTAEVTVQVHRVPGFRLRRPLVAADGELQFIASASTVEAAAQLALDDLIQVLQNSQGMSFNDAYMLCSLTAEMRISQLVDPLVTVRACIPQKYLPQPLHSLALG